MHLNDFNNIHNPPMNNVDHMKHLIQLVESAEQLAEGPVDDKKFKATLDKKDQRFMKRFDKNQTSPVDPFDNMKQVDGQPEPHSDSGDPEKQMLNALKNKKVRDMLDSLTHSEKQVIVLRFGIGGGKDYTLEQVGEIVGLTREEVRQVEARAVRKLRHPEGMDEAESPYTNSNHSQNKIKKPFGADAHTKPEGGNPQVCDCITSSGAVPNCPKCGGTGQTISPKRNDPQGILPETEVDEIYNKDDFDNVFGNRQYKKEFDYLDDLRTSGVTNMFGASRYLVQDMGLNKAEADKVLQMWMRSKEQTEDFQEEETDSDSNEAAVAKMIAKALGDDNRWTDMTAHELYAELESTNTELAKVIQLTAKMLYDVKLTEAKNCI